MRTYGKCNDSHAPLHRLKQYSAFLSEPNIPEGPEHVKYQHYMNAQGEVHKTTTAVATSK